jgi:hypothetical protein
MGEIMKKGASCAKVKILSKDYIFQKWRFSTGLIAFFTRFLKLNIKFEAKYDIDYEKNSIFFASNLTF